MIEITTTLNNILSLISCARDYGFENDVLFIAFADMIGGQLHDQEISDYIKTMGDEYGEEDREQVKQRLIEFREKYCAQKP